MITTAIAYLSVSAAVTFFFWRIAHFKFLESVVVGLMWPGIFVVLLMK